MLSCDQKIPGHRGALVEAKVENVNGSLRPLLFEPSKGWAK